MKILVPLLGRINTKNRDGGGVRFSEIFRRLQKSNWQIEIFLPPRELTVKREERIKAHWHVFNEPFRYQGENFMMIIIIYFYRLIRGIFFKPPKEVDLIYCSSDFLVELIPSIVWKIRTRAKLIVCLFLIVPNPIYGYQFGQKGKKQLPALRQTAYFLGQQLSIFLIKLFADQVLILNPLDKEKLKSVGIEENKISIVNMGVDIDTFDSVKVTEKPYQGCFIGRLHPQKGIFNLIDIWRLVVNQISEARLIIIGGGAQSTQSQIIAKIKKNNLSKSINYLGFRAGKEKISLLKRSQVFIFPSFYESWGMVAVEAMAAGLPVVAFNLPVFEEIFDQGIITAPIGNNQIMAKKIIALLKKKSRRETLGKQAQKEALKYHWKEIANREKEIINNTVK